MGAYKEKFKAKADAAGAEIKELLKENGQKEIRFAIDALHMFLYYAGVR